jgi:serine/threonine protein kinase
MIDNQGNPKIIDFGYC